MNIGHFKSNFVGVISLCLTLTILSIMPSAAVAGVIDDLNLNVAKSEAILKSMNKKARKALVNAAQDNTFKDYFTTHDDNHKHELKKKIDQISLKIQDGFNVEEICLIDPNGEEISRIVGAKIAHDLSNEEASADFFEPSFNQRPRTVYQSPIYMSPDAHKWVVAYVTPVVAENQKKAILHYEHGLDVFQRAMRKSSNSSAPDSLSSVNTSSVNTASVPTGADPTDVINLVVSAKGWIVWDQRKSIGVDKVSDSEDQADYFEQFIFGSKNIDEIVSLIDEGGSILGDDAKPYLAAYRQVNDWYLIALQETDSEVISQVED